MMMKLKQEYATYMCIKGYNILFRIVQLQVVVALTLKMMTFSAPVMIRTKTYVVRTSVSENHHDI